MQPSLEQYPAWGGEVSAAGSLRIPTGYEGVPGVEYDAENAVIPGEETNHLSQLAAQR